MIRICTDMDVDPLKRIQNQPKRYIGPELGKQKSGPITRVADPVVLVGSGPCFQNLVGSGMNNHLMQVSMHHYKLAIIVSKSFLAC